MGKFTNLAEIYHGLLQGFHQSVGSANKLQQCWRLANANLNFNFAGEQLAQLLSPAFRHLSSSSHDQKNSNTLSIYCWSSSESGVLPAVNIPFNENEETSYYLSDDLKMAITSNGSICLLLNQVENIAVFWVADEKLLPGFERAAPLRVVLHWWYASMGAQLIHAAAVAKDDKAVLITGKSGSGKSTTSLYCLQAGFDFLGDDYCLLNVDPEPTVNCVFGSAKIFPENLASRLPHFEDKVVNRAEIEAGLYDKAVIYPAMRNSCAANSIPVHAILLPTISQAKYSTLEPVKAIEVLKELAPSTLLQMPGLGQSALGQLGKLVSQRRCYRLLLGSDPQSVADVVASTWS
jgi:hypothetical protein